MTGYLKIWRKVLRSRMYKSLTSIQRDVMWVILLNANWEPNEWEWKGDVFKLKPGQLITSLSSIKKDCAKKVTYQNIRTALDKFIKWRFLTNESTKQGRLITIINWDRYQTEEKQTNKETNRQLTDDQPTTNQRPNTYKEGKKIKKVKKVKNKDINIPSQNHIPYDEIIQDLNDKTGLHFKSTTPKTRAFIKSRFSEGFTIEDFIIVHTNQADEWLNTDMAKYLRPATLYSASKFEGYLNKPKKTQRLSKTLSHNVNVVKGMFNYETEKPKRVG